MTHFVKELQRHLIKQLLQIVNLIAFLIGHTFARMRNMGKAFSNIVDNTVEGYSYGNIIDHANWSNR